MPRHGTDTLCFGIGSHLFGHSFQFFCFVGPFWLPQLVWVLWDPGSLWGRTQHNGPDRLHFGIHTNIVCTSESEPHLREDTIVGTSDSGLGG